MLLGIWLLVVKVLELVFGVKERGSFNVEICAERIDLGGFSLSMTVVYTWIIMAALTLVALILRLTVIPGCRTRPRAPRTSWR